jgi:hypothetical protein
VLVATPAAHRDIEYGLQRAQQVTAITLKSTGTTMRLHATANMQSMHSAARVHEASAALPPSANCAGCHMVIGRGSQGGLSLHLHDSGSRRGRACMTRLTSFLPM